MNKRIPLLIYTIKVRSLKRSGSGIVRDLRVKSKEVFRYNYQEGIHAGLFLGGGGGTTKELPS